MRIAGNARRGCFYLAMFACILYLHSVLHEALFEIWIQRMDGERAHRHLHMAPSPTLGYGEISFEVGSVWWGGRGRSDHGGTGREYKNTGSSKVAGDK